MMKNHISKLSKQPPFTKPAMILEEPVLFATTDLPQENTPRVRISNFPDGKPVKVDEMVLGAETETPLGMQPVVIESIEGSSSEPSPVPDITNQTDQATPDLDQDSIQIQKSSRI